MQPDRDAKELVGPELGAAVLASEIDGVWFVVTVALPVAVIGLLVGSVPSAVAVFKMEPASTSAWVTM